MSSDWEVSSPHRRRGGRGRGDRSRGMRGREDFRGRGRDFRGRGRGRGDFRGRGRGGGPPRGRVLTMEVPKGRDITNVNLVTNFFHLDLSPLPTVVSYRVDYFDPEIENISPGRGRFLYEKLSEQYGMEIGFSVFDYSHRIFLFKPLDNDHMDFRLDLGEDRTQVLTMSKDGEVNFPRDQSEYTIEHVTLIELLFRKLLESNEENHQRYQITKRGVFDKSTSKQLETNSLFKITQGFGSAFRITKSCLLLNIDIIFNVDTNGGSFDRMVVGRGLAYGAVRRDQDISTDNGMHAACLQILRNKNVSRRILSGFKGMRIELQHRRARSGRVPKKTILRIDLRKTPRQQRLEGDNPKTVEEYFSEAYNVGIRDPQTVPLIQVAGSAGRVEYYPPDVCIFSPNQKIELLTQDRAIVTVLAAKTLEERFKLLNQFVGNQRLLSRDSPCNIDINPNFVEAKGHVLPPPRLQFGNSGYVDLHTCNAMWNLARRQFFIPSSDAVTPVILYPSIAEQNVTENFQQGLDIIKSTGIRMERPIYQCYRADSDMDHPGDGIVSFVKGKNRFSTVKNPFFFVVIPDNSETRYSALKTFFDLDMRRPSQMIIGSNLRGGIPGKFGNIAAAMNEKIFSKNSPRFPTNWTISGIPLAGADTVFIGIDVHHPPVGMELPSTAGVVFASYGSPTTPSYYSTYVVQHSRMEGIQKIGECVREYLTWRRKLKMPAIKNFIVLRDGIAHSQLENIGRKETDRIIKEVLEVYKEDKVQNEPKFMYLIVQKRNNARLAVKSNGTFYAPPPGTVLDNTVTEENCFYLLSCRALQGSPRPFYCINIRNDQGLSNSDIQKMLYYLCFLHFGCTTVVSLPAPTYFAHKMAFRVGRTYRSAFTTASDVGSTFSEAEPEINIPEELKESLFYL